MAWSVSCDWDLAFSRGWRTTDLLLDDLPPPLFQSGCVFVPIVDALFNYKLSHCGVVDDEFGFVFWEGRSFSDDEFGFVFLGGSVILICLVSVVDARGDGLWRIVKTNRGMSGRMILANRTMTSSTSRRGGMRDLLHGSPFVARRSEEDAEAHYDELQRGMRLANGEHK